MAILNKKTFLIYAGIVTAILILFNIVSRNWFVRWDLTDNKMFSLSQSSKSVISKIDDRLTMKVYFSKDLPNQLGNTERFLQDMLEEYEAYSKGNIHFEFYRPDDDEKLQEEAQKSGIRPVQVQDFGKDEFSVKQVYLGMSLLYEDKRENIPLIQNTTGLEYTITTKIKKLVDINKETIGIAQTISDPYTNQGIGNRLREAYNIQEIELSNPLPSNIGVLIVNGVSDSLNENQFQNLSNYIKKGGDVLISQGRVKVTLNKEIGFFEGTNIRSNIFDLINEFGVNIEENLVLDKQNGKINIPQQVAFFQSWASFDYPFFPTVNTFNYKSALVNSLENIQFHYSSEITIDSSAQNVTPIMFSSENSSTMAGFYNLYPNTKESNTPIFNQLDESGKILGVVLNTSSDGQIILISESGFFADPLDQNLIRVFAQRQKDNYTFVENSIDYLMGDEELISLRSREVTNRPLKELEYDERIKWKWINILLPSLLVVGFGFIRLKHEGSKAKVLEEIYD